MDILRMSKVSPAQKQASTRRCKNSSTSLKVQASVQLDSMTSFTPSDVEQSVMELLNMDNKRCEGRVQHNM